MRRQDHIAVSVLTLRSQCPALNSLAYRFDGYVQSSGRFSNVQPFDLGVLINFQRPVLPS